MRSVTSECSLALTLGKLLLCGLFRGRKPAWLGPSSAPFGQMVALAFSPLPEKGMKGPSRLEEVMNRGLWV